MGQHPYRCLGNNENQSQRLRLVWNTALETGGLLVGDDVAITIDAEFIKA
jgi:hypothetical protein